MTNPEPTNTRAGCYAALRTIPKGKLTTYKNLANHLGTRGFRAVGQMLNRNPDAPVVPCHRVVKTDGDVGGYAFGRERKIEMLRDEGIEVDDCGRVVNLSNYLFLLDKN